MWCTYQCHKARVVLGCQSLDWVQLDRRNGIGFFNCMPLSKPVDHINAGALANNSQEVGTCRFDPQLHVLKGCETPCTRHISSRFYGTVQGKVLSYTFPVLVCHVLSINPPPMLVCDGFSSSFLQLIARIKAVPPECHRGFPFSTKGDVYGIGAVLYEAACGFAPLYMTDPINDVLGTNTSLYLPPGELSWSHPCTALTQMWSLRSDAFAFVHMRITLFEKEHGISELLRAEYA